MDLFLNQTFLQPNLQFHTHGNGMGQLTNALIPIKLTTPPIIKRLPYLPTPSPDSVAINRRGAS